MEVLLQQERGWNYNTSTFTSNTYTSERRQTNFYNYTLLLADRELQELIVISPRKRMKRFLAGEMSSILSFSFYLTHDFNPLISSVVCDFYAMTDY
ncbi:unnamed protein product [Amoebophrya sp. A120]|nr:unnamed protein product [Amoebophrya sp. A120]|eukprot:GSA120T00008579001.1